MDNQNEIKRLKNRIEETRESLNELLKKTKYVLDEEVLRLSQALDQLVLEYINITTRDH